MERGLKAALMKDGCGILEGLLNQPDAENGPEKQLHDVRSRNVQSLLGEFSLKRGYYRSETGEYIVPMDRQLGLLDRYTPGAQKVMLWAGATDGAFVEAEKTLSCLAGLNIPSSQIRRVIQQLAPKLQEQQARILDPEQKIAIPTMYIAYDGTGIPMRKEELEGRKGRQPDGSAKTREVKLGCVFTQHTADKDGYPLRDHDSTSYVATLCGADDFGAIIRSEARRRGLAYAQTSVVIGDGAKWIWNTARIDFPMAIQILDFYHACEHLMLLAEAVHKDKASADNAFRKWRGMMKKGRITKVANLAGELMPRCGIRRQAAMDQLAYFHTNTHRMRYDVFRKKSLFIGSGVVEAGCKSVVGKRAKQSGMLWSAAGAQNILDLRCLILSNYFNNTWAQYKSAA